MNEVQAEVDSMSAKKAAKQKILGFFNQSSKDNEIRELKGEVAKVKAAKSGEAAYFQQQLEEDARKHRELENRVRQLEKDKDEEIKRQLSQFTETTFIPFMKEVWQTLIGISGEIIPAPKDNKP